ncbi:MAG: PAS domain S-box protein [Candidatus Omnitrophota bacterium]
MAEKLRILILEDNPTDAELMERELKKEKMEFVSKRVETEEDFIKEIEDFAPDIILSDYKLPTFDGMRAIEIVKKQAPMIPFIIVTGSLSEEVAAECIKAGAWDYVIKEHLVRLVPAIKGAMERKKMAEEKTLAEKAVKESERKYRSLFDEALDMIHIVDVNGKISDANKIELKTMGYSKEEYFGKPLLEVIHPDYREVTKKALEKILQGEEINKYETAKITKEGKKINVEVNVVPQVMGKKVIAARAICRDITERKKAEEREKKDLQRLKTFYEASFGREERILELKQKVEELKKKLEERI